jgi:hypothetical protein
LTATTLLLTIGERMDANRITIEARVDCRNSAGDQLTVLQWRRQVAEARAGEPARWRAVGPAVFTLFDSSAVIQVGASALQVVATGMVLDVINQSEFATSPDGEVLTH